VLVDAEGKVASEVAVGAPAVMGSTSPRTADVRLQAEQLPERRHS
jgi:hypothetical protein